MKIILLCQLFSFFLPFILLILSSSKCTPYQLVISLLQLHSPPTAIRTATQITTQSNPLLIPILAINLLFIGFLTVEISTTLSRHFFSSKTRAPSVTPSPIKHRFLPGPLQTPAPPPEKMILCRLLLTTHHFSFPLFQFFSSTSVSIEPDPSLASFNSSVMTSFSSFSDSSSISDNFWHLFPNISFTKPLLSSIVDLSRLDFFLTTRDTSTVFHGFSISLFFHLYLSKISFDTKLKTVSPNHCLAIQSTVRSDRGSNCSIQIFIYSVQITHSDIFNNGKVIIHVILDFIAPLFPSSIIEVSNPIIFPGLLVVSFAATANITALLEKAGCKTFANLIQASGFLKIFFETAEDKGLTLSSPNDAVFKAKGVPDLNLLQNPDKYNSMMEAIFFNQLENKHDSYIPYEVSYCILSQAKCLSRTVNKGAELFDEMTRKRFELHYSTVCFSVIARRYSKGKIEEAGSNEMIFGLLLGALKMKMKTKSGYKSLSDSFINLVIGIPDGSVLSVSNFIITHFWPFTDIILIFSETKIISITIDNEILFNNIDTFVFVIPTLGIVTIIRSFLHSSTFTIYLILVHFLFYKLDFTSSEFILVSFSIIIFSSPTAQPNDSLLHSIPQNPNPNVLSSPHIDILFAFKNITFNNTFSIFTHDEYGLFSTIESISDLEDKVNFEGMIMIQSNYMVQPMLDTPQANHPKGT